jgi:hypothetical protein
MAEGDALEGAWDRPKNFDPEVQELPNDANIR